MKQLKIFLWVWLLGTSVFAQFPPHPEGITTINSKFHHGIKISYKEPRICETTPGVRSYSGYIHLPPGTLNEPEEAQDYPINTFFWFFEARKDPHNAPLSIWLNGGPGGSSLYGALNENGPCFVGSDSNSTYLNEWSWNNEVNMLYIDQPNQVGFSYGTLQNITQHLLLPNDVPPDTPHWQFADFSKNVPAQNNTFLVGTFGSMNRSRTANSTHHSAVALWHFVQTWFAEFPAYAPNDNRISLWAESYGGKYGPAVFSHFQRQNEKISRGELTGSGLMYLHLDTLGIVNGCIDNLIQDRAYADFAHNNTYGIKAFSDLEYGRAVIRLERRGGINDHTRECQRLARKADPNNIGDVEHVNMVCRVAGDMAGRYLVEPYIESDHGWFDITHPFADPFPLEYSTGFLNQQWVQRALGVPVNYTMGSEIVSQAFNDTGDISRGGMVEDIAYLLDSGVKVALMYGDRDFACNWIGGERVSERIPYSRQTEFTEAGYAPIEVTPFYSGGQTRQLGNLSFSRIYQAGHAVPYYQPETAYKVFIRAMFNHDIATGRASLYDDLKTQGPKSTWWHLNDVLPAPSPLCYIRGRALASCGPEEKQWLRDGTAIVKDWVVIGHVENTRTVECNDGPSALFNVQP